MAFPTYRSAFLTPQRTKDDYLGKSQVSFMAGDTASAGQILDKTMKERSRIPPAGWKSDALYPEAWLIAQFRGARAAGMAGAGIMAGGVATNNPVVRYVALGFTELGLAGKTARFEVTIKKVPVGVEHWHCSFADSPEDTDEPADTDEPGPDTDEPADTDDVELGRVLEPRRLHEPFAHQQDCGDDHHLPREHVAPAELGRARAYRPAWRGRCRSRARGLPTRRRRRQPAPCCR